MTLWIHRILLLAGVLCAVSAVRCAEAQEGPMPSSVRLQRYRVIISGLPEFDCVSVKGLGAQIFRREKDKSEVTFDPRILDLTLERRFTMDREFHGWIGRARKGQVEPRDGTLMLQDASGNTVVQFNFVKARPKKWTVNVPPMSELSRPVTETIELVIQDMQMVY